MNKKYSTLVAALLVSGGVAYAVGSMVAPAAKGAAKTYVTVVKSKAGAGTDAGEAVDRGYSLVIDNKAKRTNWSLVEVGAGIGKYYLSPIAGWYLAADGTVKSTDFEEGASGAASVDVATITDGVLKIDGKTVSLVNGVVTMNSTEGDAIYLWRDSAKVDAVTSALDSISFATSKVSAADLAADKQMVASLTSTCLFELAGSSVAGSAWATTVTAGGALKFTIVLNSSDVPVMSVKVGTETLYLKEPATQGLVEYVKEADDATEVKTLGTGTFRLGTQGDVVIKDGKLSTAIGGVPVYSLGADDWGTVSEGARYLATVSTYDPTIASATGITPIKAVSAESFLSGFSKIAADTELTKAATANNTWTLKNGRLSINGKELAYAKETFGLEPAGGGNEVSYDGTDLRIGTKTIYITADGFSTSERDTLTALYAVTGTAVSATPVDKAVTEGQFVIAERVSEVVWDDNIVVKQKTAVEAGAPGSEYGDINDVIFKKDTTVEILGTVTELLAPLYIAMENAEKPADKYLSVSDGSVVFASEPYSSWVLVGKGEEKTAGKLKSLELEKNGETKIWLGVKKGTKSTLSDAPYILVEEADAVDVTYTSTGIVIAGGNAISSVLKLSDQSLLAADGTDANPLLNAIITDYVYVGDGVNFFGLDDNGVTVVTNDLSKAELWAAKVNRMQDGRCSYSFVSRKNGEITLKVDNAIKFVGAVYDKGVQLKAFDESAGNLVITGVDKNNLTPSVDLIQGTAATIIGLYRSSLQQFTASYLIHRLGSSFNLELMDKMNGETSLKGNVFEGADLVPMKYENNSLVAVTGNEGAYLLKKGDNYIVLDLDTKWGNITGQVVNGGYKFSVLSEANLVKVLNGEKVNDHAYAPYFRINYLQGTTTVGDNVTESTPIYTVQVAADNINFSYNLVTFEINSGDQKGVYLTVDAKETNKVYATFTTQNIVHGSQADNNPLNMKYVNIEFANSSNVVFKGITLNGKVLGAEAIPSDKDYFLFSKPEGQWAVSMTNAKGDLKKGVALNSDNDTQFTFTNRESGKAYSVDKMHYMGDNKYAVEYASGSALFAASSSRDTIIITPAATLKNDAVQMDGYANWKAEEVQDKVFRLMVASKQHGYYVTENHSKDSHFLGLDEEVSTSVNWRIVPLTNARTFDSDGVLAAGTDSVYIFNAPQKYTGGKYYAHQDTLAVISYALQNIDNGEYLTYESPQTTTILSMICDPNSKGYTTSSALNKAYRFILKEKADSLYNMIGVPAAGATNLSNSNKLYGATTYQKNGAVEVTSIYSQINSNDLFKVEEVNAPRYRKVAQGDTIRMFRDENNFSTLYENGEFLNLGSTAEVKKMAPALYVDTAYVNRGTNNCYQYALVVNPDRKDAIYDNAGHLIKPDTTYGRFLVNLIDSAVYTYRNGVTHNNKYINDKEADRTEVKLGFVWGYRTADKLFLTDGKDFKTVKSQINLNTKDFSIAKFAFRFVEPEANDPKGAFKIQTRYVDYNLAIAAKDNEARTETNEGYLKTINGVVVVTNSYANGEEFNMSAEKSVPTSNDQIGTNEVSIVAGNGVVTVKGGAGKTVVITNVLGQTIANTVLSSDNATIATPTGVVVVAVEGEAAVKAIVK